MNPVVLKQPILSSADKPFFPPDGHCPSCGGMFTQGFAYLSAGALLLSADHQDCIRTDRLQAFLNFGFHGVDSEMRDSSDIKVVADLYGGQFDLQWCSVTCMRRWLNTLLEQVEMAACKPDGTNPPGHPHE